MKKLLITALLMLLTTQAALADENANIKIKISGAMSDNRYFLCMPDVGCLSILAAEHGKVYAITHPIEMGTIYVTDVNNSFAVTNQGAPSSCHVTVQPNQTITISGSIAGGGKSNVRLNQLHCSVT